MKILWMDTETGGYIAGKHSLLTIALAIYDGKKVTEIREWKVKNKDYIITQEAMSQNKIDIMDHDATSLEKELVVKEIIQFIKENFREERPTIGGQNIKFDIAFINTLFKECNEEWNTYVSHKTIDTCEVLRFMYYANKVTEDISALDRAVKYFGINVNGRHTATGDILATIKVFERLSAL